jgi:hypothetical protein
MRSARWLEAAPYVGSDEIAAGFLDFHDRNPDVYDMLVTLCRRAKSRGVTRIGVKRLWEVLRWELSLTRDPQENYDLNNNYTARYSRLIMALEPDLAGIFETRRLRKAP